MAAPHALSVDVSIATVVSELKSLFHLRSSKERHGKLFIDGKDVFARLSTGFLKSLIFQLAPLVAALSYRCSDWLKVLTMICISGASI